MIVILWCAATSWFCSLSVLWFFVFSWGTRWWFASWSSHDFVLIYFMKFGERWRFLRVLVQIFWLFRRFFTRIWVFCFWFFFVCVFLLKFFFANEEENVNGDTTEIDVNWRRVRQIKWRVGEWKVEWKKKVAIVSNKFVKFLHKKRQKVQEKSEIVDIRCCIWWFWWHFVEIQRENVDKFWNKVCPCKGFVISSKETMDFGIPAFRHNSIVGLSD